MKWPAYIIIKCRRTVGGVAFVDFSGLLSRLQDGEYDGDGMHPAFLWVYYPRSIEGVLGI